MRKRENVPFLLQLAEAIISIFIVTILIVEIVFDIEREITRAINILDIVVSILFLIEFLIVFSRSKNKKTYFFKEYGWLDLISGIPAIGIFGIMHYIRWVRLLKLILILKDSKELFREISRNIKSSAFVTVTVVSLLMIFSSAISVLYFEKSPLSNIRTAEDAIWWAFSTITTVGYGDVYPVTTKGRVIGIILMTTGAGLFVTFSGFITSIFLGSKSDNKVN